MTATQRWYVRTRWTAGESPSALAVEYGVPLAEVEAEVGVVQRRIAAGREKVLAPGPVQPSSGMRCMVCGEHRYGSGTPAVVAGYLLARCSRCKQTRPHTPVHPDPQPVTSPREPTHDTRAAQVLARLKGRGWVDGSELATAEVGGSEGLKRLRELRAAGHDIRKRRHPDPRREVYQYRLEE